MQCPTLAFTVDVCFRLKNRQKKPTGRTCSDSNLLAMQVFITFAQVTGGGATGRACYDKNPHSLQLRWNLPTYRRRVAHSVLVLFLFHKSSPWLAREARDTGRQVSKRKVVFIHAKTSNLGCAMKRNAFSFLFVGVLVTGPISFVLGSLVDENSRQLDELMASLNDFDQEAFEQAWQREMANAELSEIEKADMHQFRAMVKRSPKPLFGAILRWGTRLVKFAGKIAGKLYRPKGSRRRCQRRRRWWGKK